MKTQDRLNKISNTIDPKKLVDQGFPVFYKNTPVRSGNARRHTIKTATSIEANYPYAGRLDRGYSHQSPKGMVKPTLDAIRDYINKQIGK